MNGHVNTWSAAMMKRMRELHTDGMTFSQIANRLNVEFSAAVTRNACVGKGRRMQLPPRESPIPPTPAERRARRRRAKAEKRIQPPPPSYAPPPEPERPPLGALTLVDINWHECHWPFGEHPHVLYCGKPVFKRSYCLEHFRVGYDKARKEWE